MAAGTLPPVIAVLAADITAYTAGLAEAQACMDSFAAAQESAMASLDAKMSGLGAGLGAEAGAGAAGAGAVDAEASTAAVVAADDELTASMATVGTASAAMASEVDASYASMAARTTELSAGMAAQEAKAAEANTALGTAMAGSGEAAAGASAGFGLSSKSLLAIGAAAGGAAYESVKMADQFQTQMTRLYTAAGAPKQAVEDNTQAILAMGTQVGFTGTQMEEALYHPISAGLDMATALQVVNNAAKEAQISGASLDDTTYSLSSVMKAFNLSANQSERTMASLNAVVGDGDMHFQDFNESIKNWAPTAAQMGISINSMGAGLAYLTDRGNSAQVASTRLTMGISMMATPSAEAAKLLEGLGVASSDVTASSSAMQQVLQKTGVTQNQLAVDLQQPDGLYVALNHLKTALQQAGVSGTEADSILAKIFGGGRSDKAIMSLMQNLDGLHQKFDQITADATVSHFEQNWANASNTFKVQADRAKAGLENLGIVIGSMLLPALTALAGMLATTAGFFAAHESVAIALAVVIGGVLLLSLVALGEKGLVALFKLNAGLASDLSRFATWVAAKIAGFTAVGTAAEAEATEETVAQEAGSARRLAVAITSGAAWVATQTAQFAAALAEGIAFQARMIAAWAAYYAKQLAEAVASGAKWVATTIAEYTAVAVSAVAEAAVATAAWVAANLAMIVATGGIILAVGAVIAIGYLLVTHWQQVKQVAEDVWNAVVGAVQTAWHAIENAVSVGINWVLGLFQALPGQLLAPFADIGSLFSRIGSAIVQGIWSGIQAGWSWLTSSISSLASTLFNAAKSALGIGSPSTVFADEVGQWIPAGIAQGVTDGAHTAVTATQHLATQVTQAWNNPSLGVGAGSPSLAVGGQAGGVGQVINLQLTVQGSVWTTQNLMTEIRQQLLQHGIRNGTPQINYAFS